MSRRTWRAVKRELRQRDAPGSMWVDHARGLVFTVQRVGRVMPGWVVEVVTIADGHWAFAELRGGALASMVPSTRYLLRYRGVAVLDASWVLTRSEDGSRLESAEPIDLDKAGEDFLLSQLRPFDDGEVQELIGTVRGARRWDPPDQLLP